MSSSEEDLVPSSGSSTDEASESNDANESTGSSQSQKIEKCSEISYEIVAGQRLTSKLIFSTIEKQIYKKARKYKSLYSYVCRNKDCKVRIFIDESTGKCYQTEKRTEHNHENAEAEYEELKLRNSIKNDCLDMKKYKNETVRQVFNSNISQ